MKFCRYLIIAQTLIICTQAQAQSRLLSVYEKGLSFTTKDSTFSIHPGVRMQTMFSTEGDFQGTDPWASNFVIRRARVKFEGWMLNTDLTYKIELALSPNDLSNNNDAKETGNVAKVVLDAVLNYRFLKHFTLSVGQTKLPGNRQRVVSSQRMQLVDRSQVNSIFNLDRDIGAQLHANFKAGQVVIRPHFAFSKGEGRNIITQNIGGFNYTGRLEILPLGEFTKKGDYFESDLQREPKPKLSIGGVADFNQGTARQTQTGVFLTNSAGNYLQNDLFTAFADLIFKYRGFSLMAEYAFKQVLLKPGQSLSVTDSTIIDATGRSYRTGQGVMVQFGYLFKHNIELAGRYTSVFPNWQKSFDGLDEYTIGLSKYIVDHKLKVQTDATLVRMHDGSDPTMEYRLQLEFGF